PQVIPARAGAGLRRAGFRPGLPLPGTGRRGPGMLMSWHVPISPVGITLLPSGSSVPDCARFAASGVGIQRVFWRQAEEVRRPVGGTLVGSIPAAYFTGPPRAIPTAVDGAVVRATASDVARFGLIDRRIRETTSPLDALHNACHLRLVNGYTQG